MVKVSSVYYPEMPVYSIGIVGESSGTNVWRQETSQRIIELFLPQQSTKGSTAGMPKAR